MPDTRDLTHTMIAEDLPHRRENRGRGLLLGSQEPFVYLHGGRYTREARGEVFEEVVCINLESNQPSYLSTEMAVSRT